MTIRRVAGSFVLVSALGAWLMHPAWLLLAGFVGVNLIQSTFTGFCPLESMLEARDSHSGAQTR
ncbi:MAG: DUF2892 domain-containing protein [Gemmatimonadetes bacterium]|nr:DUF2892 domain-containing protein [Gemmatimonadota bacterium]